VNFSIITPSFRNSRWLKLCIASVADQQGVEVEHIVQDSCSDDSTQHWLPQDKRVRAFIEKDTGMYDAINRGFRRARGDILAYLNCDEQYLPGALKSVQTFFEAHPQVDVVFGDFLVVDEQGNFICYRKVQVPLKHHLMVDHLPTFTCATFFRRKLVQDYGLFFDSNWRIAGDAEWMLRLLRRSIPMATLGQFTSTFTEAGNNLGLGPEAERERRRLYESAPGWARMFRRLIILHHRLRRLAGGMYSQKPFNYTIYTLQNPDQRSVFDVSKPTFVWPNRLSLGNG
jgi:glycosyltransferase involved in cell wall biosynthesis